MDQKLYSDILSLLEREVKPALGCTEPVAVAIAVARAAAEGGAVESVEVKVSPNILKNAMGVGIPGTGLIGLPVAVGLAVSCGKWEYGLEVLKDVNEDAVRRAKEFVAAGKVKVSVASSDKMLYVEAHCRFEDSSDSCCILQDAHDSIVYVSRNGRTVFDTRSETAATQEDGSPVHGDFLSLQTIWDFAKEVRLEDLDLMRREIEMNTRLCEEGLNGDYGMNVGRTISESHFFGDNLSTSCMAMTAAASDARMAGCPLPAMSNSGSGNQGITVSMPVIATARHLGSSEEELLRALTLSNLVAIHIKSYLGKLSALCGCVVASTGSACGIVMLRGGSPLQMGYAIKNMIGSISGMLCDGAKEGCAMKVASGVSCALQSALMALQGICIRPTDGIVDEDVEKTISNLGSIGSGGMKMTDSMILDIMLHK